MTEFYDEENQLDVASLSIQLKIINPSLVLISICYSEKLDLRLALEVEGIFPQLRISRDLSLATKGKQISLDDVQTELLYTMAEPSNIEKITVIHGPEGSGKTILAVEILKMKVIHYFRKHSNKKIKVMLCGSHQGEEKVPALLKQLFEETKDIKEFCTVKVKPLASLHMRSPKEFLKDLRIGYIGTPLLTTLLRKSLIYRFRINPNAIINFFEMRFLLKKNFSFASFIKLPKYFYHSHSNVKV